MIQQHSIVYGVHHCRFAPALTLLLPPITSSPVHVCTYLMCTTGSHLAHFWSRQMMYDPSVKPYGKHGLADMLEGDPLFRAKRTANELPTFTLRLGQLITDGAKVSRL